MGFEHALLFEGSTSAHISEIMSTFISDMEEQYPTGKAEGLPVTLKINPADQATLHFKKE
ncbi:MAG: hypothetical protein UT30_C0047G0006 [Candidatus Uhrbacteria bacterium GW2011_GWF2_39_13]|uniref:Uncharacterized protein n=1 Tax=Candidatus Uhrbacteria bacterium GW2011_GWF2_39_13 TaxID=1618995 RepID=A0A0G0MQY5_9BACT|nr:MAG: hypothetical protein UT30_C0047G0006 [Candidatus Uhrbacteria bacterium GW2011_GWF2_39_13]